MRRNGGRANTRGRDPVSHLLELVPDRLYALPLVFGLSRPRSMFPLMSRGFGTANCYLLKEASLMARLGYER